MPDFATLAGRYIDAWNETDAAARRSIIIETWAEDACYQDPLVSVDGHAGIDALIADIQARCAGLIFGLVGPVDGYGNRFRFRWVLAPDDSGPVAEGTDFATVTEDGRLASVIGFIDRMPG